MSAPVRPLSPLSVVVVVAVDVGGSDNEGFVKD
jgi:hypothetical protein